MLPAAVNFGAFLADAVPVGVPDFVARIFADGTQVATINSINAVARLPSGFLARNWEIEVESNCKVTALALGFSPSELAG